MKVYKCADIVNGKVIFCESRKVKHVDIWAMLANLQPVSNPRADSYWQMQVEVGEGPSARSVTVDLAPVIAMSHSLDAPTPLADGRLVYFRNRLLIAERLPHSDAEREEIVLRAKKIVYDEENELKSLRAAVSNLEAAIEYTKTGPKRDPIPEEVKLVVWARDGGACIRCGSQTELHFDHIIPVAKGGSNVEANIQILCRPCNLKKSDKIAI